MHTWRTQEPHQCSCGYPFWTSTFIKSLTYCVCTCFLFASGKEMETFSNPKVNDRELFLAFNIDTHPASLFRYGRLDNFFCVPGCWFLMGFWWVVAGCNGSIHWHLCSTYSRSWGLVVVWWSYLRGSTQVRALGSSFQQLSALHSHLVTPSLPSLDHLSPTSPPKVER